MKDLSVLQFPQHCFSWLLAGELWQIRLSACQTVTFNIHTALIKKRTRVTSDASSCVLTWGSSFDHIYNNSSFVYVTLYCNNNFLFVFSFNSVCFYINFEGRFNLIKKYTSFTMVGQWRLKKGLRVEVIRSVWYKEKMCLFFCLICLFLTVIRSWLLRDLS